MAVCVEIAVAKTTLTARGLDHSWKVVRELGRDGRTFAICDVQARAHDTRGTICDFLQRLEKAGYAERAGSADGRRGAERKLWRLLKSPSKRPAIRRSGEIISPYGAKTQQMWNFIRGPMARQSFSIADVVAYASTDEIAIQLPGARTFVCNLLAVGYLVKVGDKPTRWRLKPSMNSGPLPPVTMAARVIYDQNRHAIVGKVIAEEVPA